MDVHVELDRAATVGAAERDPMLRALCILKTDQIGLEGHRWAERGQALHPEYPCAHCIVSGGVAGVVSAVLGTDDIPEIAVTSPTAPGVTHRWTNMAKFTQEVADARIWAGFHYRFSTRVGRDMGLKIGEYVVKNVMQPVVAGSR